MAKLNTYNFKVRYTKTLDDIANEFYLPCMRNAVSYDRIAGYFGSTMLLIAWDGIKQFASNGGHMRIICSPYVSIKDQKATEQGYIARRSAEVFCALENEMRELFENEYLHDPSRALACLIAEGIIDIKVAVKNNLKSIDLNKLFHEKTGIFTDIYGNSIAFEGSMNETYNGLSSDGNLESVSVFINWEAGREKERISLIKREFEMLWQGGNDNVSVYSFPDSALNIIKKYAGNYKWEQIVDDILEKAYLASKWQADNREGRKPREYQVNALEAWEKNSRRGILEHATGSGKTYTALCAIRKALDRGEIPLILVPSKELLYQWEKELKNMFDDEYKIQILLCGDGNNHWKKNGVLTAYTTPSNKRKKAVVAIMDTACTNDFIVNLTQGNKIFLIADEVHRIGTLERRRLLQLHTGSRLGLSATPKRYGDPEGTQCIIDYFDKILQPPFTLYDAIKFKALTEYFYYPHTIKLTSDEQDEWDALSKQISKAVATRMNSDGSNAASVFEDPFVKKIILRRSRVLKNASRKIQLAEDIIKQYYKQGQRWIVYCDNSVQLREVLVRLNKIDGVNAYDYYSEMQGDREETLYYFKEFGGVLVSIKCLDEGIDIPSATHALILASSKNPREFIQRRGRILRKADEIGKMFAYLHDAIVIPNHVDDDTIRQASIIESELARAIQFGTWSRNSDICITELRSIAIEYDIDIEKMINGGTEEENETDE